MGNRKSRDYRKQEEDRALWDQARTTPRGFGDDVSAPGIGIRRVQVVFAPALRPGFAWDIRVLDATWRLFRSQVQDEEHGEPAKLLGYEELDAGGDVLRGYFDELRALALPIGPLFNDTGGLDGTNYQLSLFGDLHSEVRFRWWSDAPPQWEPLTMIVDEMTETFIQLQARDV
jgi:hypothetical protein